MSNIFAQMNPTALIAVVVLLLASLVGVIVLRLVRKGRAKNPGDLVKIARERSAAAKETKAATKRAEAAIAEPVASSRLSRISAKGMATASAARPEAVDDPAETLSDDAYQMDAAETSTWDEASEPAAWDMPELDAEAEPVADALILDEAEEFRDSAEPEVEAVAVGPDAASVPTGPIDLADPERHPADWDGLLAIVDRLDAILTQSWHDDALVESVQQRLANARQAAGEDGEDDLTVRELTRDAHAIDLARTINNAAREQAAEIVAAVREFAHQQAFSPQDCSAVLQALQQIEWMALIARGDTIERRTLPLTRHDPEAPLWVAEAWGDLRASADRAAA
jgi:hypothetical protein